MVRSRLDTSNQGKNVFLSHIPLSTINLQTDRNRLRLQSIFLCVPRTKTMKGCLSYTLDFYRTLLKLFWFWCMVYNFEGSI